MLQEYTDRLNWAQSNRKRFSKFYTKGTNAKSIDANINAAHEAAFKCTDCLSCANCCKTTGPLFTRTDIKRLSKRFGMTTAVFEQTYLRRDSDGDLVLQSTPCPFLLDDNKCSVYEDRPRACREYPHTDIPGQSAIKHLTKVNATICPAVAHIFQSLAEHK